MGIPVVGVHGAGGKLKALMEKFGLLDYSCPKTDTYQIKQLLLKLLEERNRIRQRIASVLPKVLDECRENFRLLMEHIYPFYLRKAFDRGYYEGEEQSSGYKRGWRSGYSERALRGVMEDFLRTCEQEGARLVGRALVVGCARGLMVKLLSERGVPAVGIDASKEAVVTRLTDAVEKGNVLSIPFRDKSFHTVICSEVLEHVPVLFLDRALRELCRVTERQAIIKVPEREAGRTELTHTTLLSREEWTSWLSRYFRVRKSFDWRDSHVFFCEPVL